MTAPNRLGFDVRPAEQNENGRVVVTPLVDGCSLVDLVADFERQAGFDVAGGYDGLVPSSFRYGDLCGYYLAENEEQWPEAGRLWLLACDCGEPGCWPLEASVTSDAQVVTWQGFGQPHRPTWNYSAFGPMTFDRRQYDDAVRDMVTRLGPGPAGHA